MPVTILQQTDFEINGENVSISPDYMRNTEFSTILLLTDNGNDVSKATMSNLGRFALKLQALNRDSVFYAADITAFPIQRNSSLATPVLLKVWAGGMIDDQPISSGKMIKENTLLQVLLRLYQHHYVLDGGLSLLSTKEDGFQYGGLAGAKLPNVSQELELHLVGKESTILAANQNAHVDGDGTIQYHNETFLQRLSHDRCFQRKVVICIILTIILFKLMQK